MCSKCHCEKKHKKCPKLPQQCEYTKRCQCSKLKCTKTCRLLCKPRNVPEPTGITSFTFQTIGDIADAPVIPATLSVLAKGDPTNPIAICLHGYPSAATEWRYLLDDLAAKGYYAVAPYLRGYAPTVTDPAVALPGTVVFYVISDIIDLIIGLGAFGKFGENIMIGSDFGAIIGAFIAGVPNLEGLFKKFVGINIPPGDLFGAFISGKFANFESNMRFFYGPLFNIAPEMGIFQQNLALDPNAVTGTANYRAINMIEEQWKQWSPTAYPPQQDFDIQYAKAALANDSNLQLALDYYKSFYLSPTPVALPFLSQPSLWMFGENDGIFLWRNQLTPEELTAECLSRSSPGSEVFTSKCGGHFLNLDDTEAVNARILKFIQ